MKQPPLIIPDRVDVPAAVEQTLANGVKLYMLACDEFEVVRMTFVFHAGVSMQKKPFTASATANLLGEGTVAFDSVEIAERLDYYGSWFDVNIDRDYV